MLLTFCICRNMATITLTVENLRILLENAIYRGQDNVSDVSYTANQFVEQAKGLSVQPSRDVSAEKRSVFHDMNFVQLVELAFNDKVGAELRHAARTQLPPVHLFVSVQTDMMIVNVVNSERFDSSMVTRFNADPSTLIVSTDPMMTRWGRACFCLKTRELDLQHLKVAQVVVARV